MGQIDKFLAKDKEYDFQGVKITLKPLTVRDYNLFAGMSSPNEEKKVAAMKEMTMIYLKQAFPEDAAKVEDFDIKYIEEFFDFVVDVNGMTITEEDKKKAMEQMS